MGAIRDTLLGYKHQKNRKSSKTFEDKVLKNEASEKNSSLKMALFSIEELFDRESLKLEQF